MNYRPLGRTGWQVSEIGFGAWAIGGTWGNVNDNESLNALHKAIDLGVNFIDTADVYGDGRSERLVGKVLKERSGTRIYVATKFGRRLSPHVADGFTRENLESFLDRSLDNLAVDCIDLVQLHCPPSQVYYMPEVFDVCDRLIAAGKIRHYGVSVEKVEEAIKATEFRGVQSVQIIYNIFRQRPADIFFPLGVSRQVGVLARLPLSSGMLSGKMTQDSSFEESDHRASNRDGQWFDKGETFSGVPFEVGLAAVEELRALVPKGQTMAQFALRWILMNPAVSTAIPGAKSPAQAEDNAGASSLPPIESTTLMQIEDIYSRLIRPHVHQRW